MIYRAYRMPRLEIRPSGTTPGGIFHLHERGAGWSRTGPAHVPFPKSSIGRPAQFFGQIFWEKILEMKILAPLVTIFLATHAATPPATAPGLAQDIILHAGRPAMPRLPANHP
jgi:hypothetical protein